MISEFQELSEKIDRLAALTISLRRDNAELRQQNAALGAENAVYMQRLGEVQRRVEALLEKIPALETEAEGDDTDHDHEAAR
jgi:cell division protein ZapB